MKNKIFKVALSLSSFALGVISAVFVTKGNWIIPIIAMAIVTILISALKIRVKDKVVISDERTEVIAGKAARVTWQVMGYSLAIATIIFAALSKTKPEFFEYSIITSASCFGMILTYLIASSYLNRK